MKFKKQVYMLSAVIFVLYCTEAAGKDVFVIFSSQPQFVFEHGDNKSTGWGLSEGLRVTIPWNKRISWGGSLSYMYSTVSYTLKERVSYSSSDPDTGSSYPIGTLSHEISAQLYPQLNVEIGNANIFLTNLFGVSYVLKRTQDVSSLGGGKKDILIRCHVVYYFLCGSRHGDAGVFRAGRRDRVRKREDTRYVRLSETFLTNASFLTQD